MRALLALPIVAVAATLAARPAAAQVAAAQVASAQADLRRPAVATAAAPAAAAIRPAATYRLAALRGAGLPAEVTVGDAGGEIVAHYRLDGERAARPMAVTVLDADLVLQADTPSGLLTILLDGENGDRGGPVTGRWWLGDARGALRGR